MFAAVLARLLKVRMDVYQVIGLSIVMCTLAVPIVAFAAVTQPQPDVRLLILLYGTVVVLATLAVLYALATRGRRRR